MCTTSQNDATTAAEDAVQVNKLKSTPLLRGPSGFSFKALSMNDERKFEFELQMRERFLGAVRVKTFLEKYLSPKGRTAHIPSHLQNLMGSIPRTSDAQTMYYPYVKAIANCTPEFKTDGTSSKLARSEFADFQLNLDVRLFNANFSFKNLKGKSYFSVMEIKIELKHRGAPFADPPTGKETDHAFEVDSESARLARGQLTAYAVVQHTQQFRHSSFSVRIANNRAHFLRWDPTGVVVTKEYNSMENPDHMAKLFWSFSDLTNERRGHDLSICRMKNGDAMLRKEVRTILGLDANRPLFEHGVPGVCGRCYRPTPPYPSCTIVDRSTRPLTVSYKPCIQPEIAWRHRAGNDRKTDITCEIYRALNAMPIPRVPKLEGRRDIMGYSSTTETRKLVNEPRLESCSKPKTTGFTHTRLVLEAAGRPLSKFRSTKELVNGILCAIVAHERALKLLKLLHRDINFTNIVLTDDGNCRLIDWDLVPDIGDIGNPRPEPRTGTWQFTSAKLLPKVRGTERRTLTDDLESFLHVLGWTTVCYVPSTEQYTSGARKEYLASHFDYYKSGGRYVGGEPKAEALAGTGYPPVDFVPKDPSPLPALLRTLSEPFRSRYSRDPPTARERADYEQWMGQNTLADSDPSNLSYTHHRVYKHDFDFERLKSHDYFIKTIKDALDGAWPSNDKANSSLVNLSTHY